MKKDLIKYSFNNLWQRKRRSFLTILSVFIGIMAVFALVSFGQGIQNYVDNIAKEMGADKIIVQPQGGFGNPAASTFKMEEKDLDFIKKFNGIADAEPSIMNEVIVQNDLDRKGKVVFASSIPVETGGDLMKEILTVDIAYGRELKKGDIDKIVVGFDYTQDNKVFKKGIKTGEKIFVNQKKVEVVGVYASLGNPQDDQNIYFTEDGIIQTLNVEKKYSTIIARASPTEDPRELAKQLKDKLRRFKGEEKGKETFIVQTLQDMIESFSIIIDVINGVLVMIALISVVVAAVNILNTMYTAVLERTGEIGIMKAIGAQNSSILFIFVFESGFLGFVGSLMGMALGYGIAELGGLIAAGSGYSGLQPAYPAWLVIGVLVFGFAIGALSGLAPAIQASKQKPVESLRYE